jgi:hypothetical protein
MLEENTECWICKRTEREIIAEIINRKWSERIFDEIRKENKENMEGKPQTKEGLISLVDVGTLDYSYPVCAFCAGLIYTVSDRSASDRLNYEIDEGALLTGSTIFIPKAQE